jgi:hypothetical protein
MIGEGDCGEIGGMKIGRGIVHRLHLWGCLSVTMLILVLSYYILLKLKLKLKGSE